MRNVLLHMAAFLGLTVTGLAQSYRSQAELLMTTFDKMEVNEAQTAINHFLEDASYASERYSLPWVEAQLRYLAGVWFLSKRNVNFALEHLLWVFNMSESNESQHLDTLRVHAGFQIGQLLQDQGLYTQAISYYQSIQYRSSPSKTNEIRLKLAQCLYKTGDHNRADSIFSSLIAVAPANGPIYEKALYHQVIHDMPPYFDATTQQQIDKLTSLYTASGRDEKAARILLLWAKTLQNGGDPQSSNRIAEKVLPMVTSKENKFRAQLIRSTNYMLQQNFEVAGEVLDIARSYIGDNDTLRIRHQQFSSILELRKENYRLALVFINQAIASATNLGLTDLERQCLEVKKSIYEAQNKLAEANALDKRIETLRYVSQLRQEDIGDTQRSRQNNLLTLERSLSSRIQNEIRNRLQIQQYQLEAERARREEGYATQQLALNQLELDRQRLENEARKEREERINAENKLFELDLLEKERTNQLLRLNAYQEQIRTDSIRLSAMNQSQELANEKIRGEQRRRNFLIIMTSLSLLVLVVTGLALVSRSRDHRLLKRKNAEIEYKNKQLMANEEELLQNMEELNATQEMLQKQTEMLLAGGNLGTWEVEFPSRTLKINEQFAQILNIEKRKDFKLNDWRAMIADEDKNAFNDLIEASSLGLGEFYDITLRMNTRRGVLKYINLSTRKVINLERKTESLLGILIDITDIKTNEIVLRDKNEELNKINEELDHFVYRTSHNLRAPITSIMGLIRLMNTDDRSETDKKYFDLILKSIVKMDDTIKEINNYSKNNRTEVIKKTILLDDLIEDALDDLQFYKDKLNLQVIKEYDKDFSFISDPQRIEMIFSNLLSNAIKYSHPRRELTKITISATREKGRINFTVADNGIGIGQEHLEKIFQMFYRATDRETGSGLGLYIVREAIHKLGGEINIQSQLNEGTSIKFYIKQFMASHEQLS